MAGVINTGSNPKALWPGIYKFWGLEYNKHPHEYKELFDMKISDKSYEEMVELIGFGLAPEKEQGTSVQYASTTQGTVNRYTNKAYALGYIVTHEEDQDNLYKKVAQERAMRLAFSMRTTKENVGANIYNRGFDPAFAFADGQPLLSASHPTQAGNQSNILAVPADLSELALEDICILVSNMQDSAGLQISLRPRSLHVPTALQFEAARILDSVLQNDTANNALNVLKSGNMFPEGWKMNHYFTDTDAWFVRTDASAGLCYFEREKISFSQDNDFDTDNFKYKAYERYVPGVSDWRAIVGSPGA